MADYTFKLPDVGEGIAESEIALWRVAVGDTVSEDQPLVDMLTDKAAVEIPSPVAGTVLRLHGEVGDKVAVGAPLVVISPFPPAGEAPSPGASRPPLPQDGDGMSRAAAAPAVRKLARERGIDLQQVRGSGPSGRILREDLDRAMRPSVVDDDSIVRAPLIGLRRKIAEAMVRSTQRIPHFTYVEEVDVTELEALRAHLNRSGGGKERPKLTLLPFLIQALVRAVAAFPMVNATFDDEAGIVTRHRALHVGIATQTPNGLLVPVLRHAQRLDPWERASAIRRVTDAARAGKGTREELSGSTITITSLGALGGIATTPVINAPEVAIIGVNKMMERPVARGGQLAIRTLMNLSSSFDHRIVDGHDAASFIQQVKARLEHPATLFLESH